MVYRSTKNGEKDGEMFILGSTGDIIQGLGAMEQDIYMLSDKINIILGKHPEMSVDLIKKIPDVLERPVLIMKSLNEGSVNTRLTIFGNTKTSTGPMMVVLDLRPKENKVAIEDMQKAVSAYAKNVDKRGKTAKEFIEESEILFVNKKRIARLLRPLGFARPNELHLSDSIGRVSYMNGNVNIEGKTFDEVFKTNSSENRKMSLDDYSSEADKDYIAADSIKYSLVKDKDLISKLDAETENPDDYIVTYRAMAKIDGKYYPPMSSKIRDDNGNWVLLE